jgi:hypothetical protein
MDPDAIAAQLARKKAEREQRLSPTVNEPHQNGSQSAHEPPTSRVEPEPLPEEREARPVTAWRRERSFGNHVDVHRSPPHSAEAEQGVLGSMILEPKFAIPIAVQELSVFHFYIPAHTTVFTVLVELWTAGEACDLITFTQVLRDRNLLDAIGGASFVTSLYTFVPTAANVSYYIDIVKDKFALRELIAANTEFVRRAYEEQDDVGALLREFGEHSERVVKGAISGGSRLPALRDLSLMLGDNLPTKPAELVKGILHQGSKIIVGGTSKGRKTFALLDLAISVASGTPWWGFETIKGPVCYINFEIQEPFFAGRTQDICRAKGINLAPNMLHAWNLRGHGEGIENMVAELLFVLRLRPWVLIIFDPIYKALGNRDENKAGDVASMLNQLERIAVHTGAAIGFGAHYSKGNQAAKESIDRIGGSGVFARDPDAILTMTAHEEEDAFTVDTTLRNFSPLSPFVVQWKWPVFTRADDLDPEELKQPKKNKGSGQFTAKYSPDDILDQLSVIQGIRPTELRNLTTTLRSMSRATFYRIAMDLERKGLLIEKDGEWFHGKQSDLK